MRAFVIDLSRARLPVVVAISLSLVGCNRPEGHDSASGSYPTRSSSGDISFEVTPRGVIDGRFVVDIRANTHRGDLAELDLGNVVVLATGGEELRPAQADRLQGHHAAGTVAFQMNSVPERFEIVVRGARDMPERRLQWP